MTRNVIVVKSLWVLMAASSGALAHPSLPGNGHVHNTSTVKWEADGVRDGSSAHNHFDPLPYPGAETLIQPATFGACWDNLAVRVDANDLSFDKGHCFINQIAINSTPGYYFSGQWNSSAKSRVRDAFETYNAILLLLPGYQLGMGFAEVGSSSAAQIIVTYDSCSDCINGGRVHLVQSSSKQYLKFDSDFNWSFQKNKSGIAADKWHFFSVALHEIGHVVGLGHQPAGDTEDLMSSPSGNHVGAPLNMGGRHFDQIDDDSVFGVVRLYTQSFVPPSITCMQPHFLGCPLGCMSSPYMLEWYSPTATSFQVQRSGVTGWNNWYTGSSSTSFASTGTVYPEYFRARASNAAGTSAWCYVTLYVQCSEEMDPW